MWIDKLSKKKKNVHTKKKKNVHNQKKKKRKENRTATTGRWGIWQNSISGLFG